LGRPEQCGGGHRLNEAVEPVGVERCPVTQRRRRDPAEGHPAQRRTDGDQHPAAQLPRRDRSVGEHTGYGQPETAIHRTDFGALCIGPQGEAERAQHRRGRSQRVQTHAEEEDPDDDDHGLDHDILLIS